MNEKPKRKTITSTEVKNRYNKKVYTPVSIRVPKDLAEQFKAKCIEEKVSQAEVLKKAMENFINK